MGILQPLSTPRQARRHRQNQVCSHLDHHLNLILRTYLRRQSGIPVEFKKIVKLTESITALCVFTRKTAHNFVGRNQNQVCSHFDHHWNLIPRIYLRCQSGIEKSVNFLEPEVDLMYS